MRNKILILTALLGGALPSLADVTVQGWWHYGEVPDYYADSSGNTRRFGEAFSRVGSGNAGAGVEPFGCGGPLDSTGFTSTNCLYWTPTAANAAAMWDPGNSTDPAGVGYNPPATNYVIELWCIPEAPGTLGGNGAWLFCSGSGGGVTFDLTNDPAGDMAVVARVVPLSSDAIIGDPWVVNTNMWTHLAIVNNNGTNTFYVDGVQHGASLDPSLNTTPSGTIYAGGAPGTQPTYEGYLDELRISTFAAGHFSLTDLLTRAFSPDITVPPQNETVWNGGAAPFTVSVAIDTTTTYQWQSNSVSIPNATGSEYYLNVVTPANSNEQFDVVLNNSANIAYVTSSVATLAVVPPLTTDVNFYRNAVTQEVSLAAYYTVDNDTGTSLSDSKGSNNGTLEGTAEFEGRTNRAFGVRSLRFLPTADGDVTIPPESAFDLPNGVGTIEAVVYLDHAIVLNNETIVSEGFNYGNGGPLYYALQATPDGTSLVYTSDSATAPVSWPVPTPLLGRMAHVAFVFTNNTITAYADGLSLGTKANTGFGSASGLSLNVGSETLSAPGEWCGSIDELAIYTNALPASTIAIHNSRFANGTNVSAPTVTAPVAFTKTLLAGGSPTFGSVATGTAPLSYLWYHNGSPLANQTGPTLMLTNTTTAGSSGTYYVQVANPIGTNDSATFTLTFVAAPDAYSAQVIADDPLAFWRLDETSGTTAYDLAGGHDGTYSGSMTLGGPGPIPTSSEPAVHLSGGYAQVPYSPVLNPATAFTVEFLANPDNEPAATYVPLCSQYRNGGTREGWAIYDENDALSFEDQMGGGSGGVSYYAYGGGPEPFGGHWYYVAAVWNGSNTLTVYCNNQIVGQNTSVGLGGVYVPNPSAPWWIGVRADGNYSFDGSLSSVAMYNYAFTQYQASNHWSVLFTPSAITQQPVGVTNIEGSTITLTGAASGYLNSYQWWFGTGPLIDLPNPDGSSHYPNDVTNTTLVISQAELGDSGLYSLHVLNPLPGGGSISSSAKVLVYPDTNAPTVALVRALGTPNAPGFTSVGPAPFLVKVGFDKRVDPNTGGTLGNYAVSGGVTVNSVTMRQDTTAESLGSDWKEVILETSGLTPGQQYTLSVSNVLDQASTPNKMAPAVISFFAPPLQQGVLYWDYYDNMPANSTVADLEADVYYPYVPSTNWYFTAFDSDQVTGGDLNNNPAFGSLGDNYGDVVSGWLTPTNSASYTFFLACDDTGELDLSPDANPAHAVVIATQATANGTFQETNSANMPPQTSALQALTAGTSYFIRALHTEHGGGDYVKVAWRASTDTTPASKLSPIPGQFFSSYVLLPPKFGSPSFSQGKLTLNWTGLGALYQSSDLKTWTPVAGNPASGYQVTPTPGQPHLFYQVRQ